MASREDLVMNRGSLITANYVAQIDRKFLMLTFGDGVLGIIDQRKDILIVNKHIIYLLPDAASERVNIEHKFSSLPPVSVRVNAFPMSITSHGAPSLIKNFATSLRFGGFDFSNEDYCVAMPKLIGEQADYQRRTRELITHYIEDLSQKRLQCIGDLPPTMQYHLRSDWKKLSPMAPQGLIAMLTTKACRESVMFNDLVSKVQATQLVHNLAACHFP